MLTACIHLCKFNYICLMISLSQTSCLSIHGTHRLEWKSTQVWDPILNIMSFLLNEDSILVGQRGFKTPWLGNTCLRWYYATQIPWELIKPLDQSPLCSNKIFENDERQHKPRSLSALRGWNCEHIPRRGRLTYIMYLNWSGPHHKIDIQPMLCMPSVYIKKVSRSMVNMFTER